MSMQSKQSQPSHLTKTLRVLLAAALLLPSISTQQAPQQGTGTVIQVFSDLVLTNVVVRDSHGNYVRDLKPENFTILEDNKPQQITSFDFEDVEAAAATAGPQQSASVLPVGPQPIATQQAVPATTRQLKDCRLVVLFFDLSSMEPDEVDRAIQAAEQYIDKQMSPADLVSVVSLATSLEVKLDFTADRQQIRRVVESFDAASGQGFEQGLTGTTEGTPDTGQSFTADETEYNIFNVDFRLEALRSLARMLSGIEQKKSVIYISNGMTRTGIENQAALRAAINAAVRANVAIYTMDIRGLQALVPGGDAQQASLRGQAAYSGAATLNALNSNFSSQETLVTIAADTGGRAFLDTNDFGAVFRGVQQDTASYYVLGYVSSNPVKDGRYRRITVRVNRPDLKLDYRRGYYAPADFQHFTQQDRERQLAEELSSDLPSTDFPVYLSTASFRIRDDKIFNSVSLLVPGSEIPFTRSKDQDQATLDLLGVVQDDRKHVVGKVRETIKLAVPESQQVRRKNVQYDTGFVLAPGNYQLKFVLRENQTGRMGSFQADMVVPDFKTAPVKESSVVLAAQTQPTRKRQPENPLNRDGTELIPNVMHVFSQKQHLYLYYEVYDPTRGGNSVGELPQELQRRPGNLEANPLRLSRRAAEGNALPPQPGSPTDAASVGAEQAPRLSGTPVSTPARQNAPENQPEGANEAGGEPGIRLLTNVLFFHGKVKAYETPLVEARRLNVPDRQAVVFQLDVPLAQLRPGLYTCQVNVIDDAGGRFAFRRLPLTLIQ